MGKGSLTRMKILDQAISMASVEGLSGVSIGRLAEQVGMSKSGLFAHFSSKDALDVAVLEASMDSFRQRVVLPALAAPRGEPRVKSLFDHWLAWGHRLDGGCVFVTAAVELDDKPGPARDKLVSAQKDWLQTLATAVKIAVDEGHFRTDADPDQVAHEMYCLGWGHHNVARLLRDPQAQPRTHRALERLFASVRGPGRKPAED